MLYISRLLLPSFLAIVCPLSLSAQRNIPSGNKVPASLNILEVYLPISQTVKINYIKTREALLPLNDENTFNNSPYTAVKETTQYFDGLSRPLQVVGKRAGVGAVPNDIVSPIVYDEFGREQYKYLPYAATTGDGSFRTDPFNEQFNFYTNTYKADQPALNGEQYFYSKTVFEPSPLNRVEKTFAPGNSWAGSEGGNEHAIGMQYLINTENDDVRIWNIGFDETFDNNIPTSTVHYNAGELYKTVTTDEKGSAVVEYKDKEGHVILKKVQIGTVNSSYEGHTGWLCTYYVYDDLGNLRFVIPPKAVAAIAATWSLTPSVIKELCFHYEYDGRNRMIGKKVPGAAWVNMVYDKRNRLVFTQDGNLAAKDQWMTTLYDELNRPIQTGIVVYAGATRAILQTHLDTLADNASSADASVSGSTAGSAISDLVVSEREAGRTTYKASNTIEIQSDFTSEDNADFVAEIVPADGTAFTSTQSSNYYPIPAGKTFIPLTITYYDSYDGIDKSYAYNSNLTDGGNSYADSLPSTQNNAVKGMVTATKVRVLTSTDVSVLANAPWIETVSFYDNKGRLVQVKTKNYKGGEDVMTSRYDFTGKVVSTYTSHTNNSGGVTNLAVLTEMKYDHAGRLIDTWKTIAGKRKLVAHNDYDALGQLKHKDIGQKSDNAPLESQDYAYNIRGWMKGINWDYSAASTDPTKPVTATANNKWFAMDLSYDWGYQNNQYNGNIAGMRWQSAGDSKERSYGYDYDKANRLLKGDFTQNFGSGNTNNWTTADPQNGNFKIDFSVKMGTGNDDGSAYDENGNIARMQQWGLKVNASPKIDDLYYQYYSGNKLKSVSDQGELTSTENGKLGDFKDGESTGDDYGYDVNGNMVVDKNKKIGSSTPAEELAANAGDIQYNHLNLPYKITVNNPNGSSGTITYIYDATGNKVEKITDETTGTPKKTYTTYLSGYVYENNVLKFFGHEEGRVRLKTNADGTKGYAFDYFIKDHLGNVRMVLTDEQQTNAYPPASLETTSLNTEKQLYTIPDDASVRVNRNQVPGYPTTDTYTSPNDFVHELNGNGTKIGSSIVLKVMSGDTVNIRATSWYRTNGAGPGQPVINPLNELVAALANGIAGASGGKIQATQLQQPSVLPVGAGKLFNDRDNNYYSSQRPKAFLNWVLFDEQFNYVAASSGFEQVPNESEYNNGSNTANVYNHVKSALPITSNGYLYVYVSNESSLNVYFDNLQVTHIRGPLLEETHYYPFGLAMSGISSKAAGGIQNKNKFNGGNELQSGEFSDGSGLEMYDAVHRMYDQQLGKFHQIDALADVAHRFSPYAFANDNPISLNDPLGLSTTTPGVNPDNKDDNAILAEVVVTNKRKSSGGFAGFYWPSSTSSERKQWRDNQNLYYSRTLNNQPAVQKGDPLSYRSSVGLYKKWDIEEQNYRAMQSFAVGIMATPVLVSTAPTAVITALRFKLAANVPAAVADVISQAAVNGFTGKNVITNYNPVSTALAFGIGPVAEGVNLPAIANIAGVSLLSATVSTSVNASINSFSSGSNFSFNPTQIIINAVFGAAAGSNGRVVELGGSKAIAEGASAPFNIAGGLFSDKAQ